MISPQKDHKGSKVSYLPWLSARPVGDILTTERFQVPESFPPATVACEAQGFISSPLQLRSHE